MMTFIFNSSKVKFTGELLALSLSQLKWVAAKTTQTPIYPTHSPKDRFTQFLERRQNFTHSPKA